MDYLVTKKGKLIQKNSSPIFQSNLDSFGETIDRETQILTQIPLIFVFPSEDSHQKCFNPKVAELGKISQINFENMIKNKITDESNSNFLPENEGLTSDLIEKAIFKISNKTITIDMLRDPLTNQLHDVDKIAGMLQIAPDIFEIESQFHELFLSLERITKMYHFLINKRKNLMFFCQNQIYGNEIIFVALVNFYK